ncbi:MAG: L-cystine transporter [Psychromonas sp.]|nr:L-cystine transporter [Psychromonas sp.]
MLSSTTLYFIVFNLVIFVLLMFFLNQQQRKGRSLSCLVLLGLVAGSTYGLALHLCPFYDAAVLKSTLQWISLVSGGYVGLLKMIIMPLILVSMFSAVVKIDSSKSLGKISGLTIGILLFTTMIAAFIGIFVTESFGLSAASLVEGTRESAREVVLQGRVGQVSNLNIPHIILSFIPKNPFADLTGARSTSLIASVLFSTILGVAAHKVSKEDKKLAASIKSFVDVAQSIVMRLVKMIMSLTPYGILALLVSVVADSNANDMLHLLGFIVASYVAILLMFMVHGFLVSLVGISPISYFKLIWPVLMFAFSSRSSAATIPLNIDTQINKLTVPPAIANFSATFGATIGQNGCAGIYPAMLAVMVAPTVGIHVDFTFIISLVAMVVIGSFGIAGVGGGATLAALVVLPTMGLPITIVALLISIEPLIDMARTALNVSGAMTAGVITSRILVRTDKKFKAKSIE